MRRRRVAERQAQSTGRARYALAMLATVAVAGGLTGCLGSSESTPSVDVEVGDWGAVLEPGGDPVRGGVLRIDQGLAPEGISPLHFLEAPTNPTIQVMMQVFDQLVELETGSLEPQPGLAEDWKISEDGLTYTFDLRDASFSDGSPVTSSDVAFTLTRAQDSVFADLFAAIEKIQTPDDSTVVLTLSRPTPGMLYFLAFPGASIMPGKIVNAMGEDAYNRMPVGSGAFVVQRWSRDRSVELERNENYWREGLPYLDRVELVAVTDDNTRALNVRSGTTDVADSIPFAQISPLNESGEANVLVAPGADMYVLGVNNSLEPFDEPEVRRALAYATPVDSIIDVVFSGEAPAMNTVLPKLKYWTDAAKRYPYDVNRARAELAKSSVPDGFATTVNVAGSDQASKQTAQILKEAYREIGVDVTIQTLDDATRSERFQAGEYEMNITPPGRFTSDVPVDDQFATLLFDSPAINNLFSFYENPALAKLTREATSETDESKRRKLFAEIHIQAMETPPSVPIAYPPNRAVVRDGVHGFNYLLNGWWRLENVWKEPGA